MSLITSYVDIDTVEISNSSPSRQQLQVAVIDRTTRPCHLPRACMYKCCCLTREHSTGSITTLDYILAPQPHRRPAGFLFFHPSNIACNADKRKGEGWGIGRSLHFAYQKCPNAPFCPHFGCECHSTRYHYQTN
jgi:hypothetical protein